MSDAGQQEIPEGANDLRENPLLKAHELQQPVHDDAIHASVAPDLPEVPTAPADQVVPPTEPTTPEEENHQ